MKIDRNLTFSIFIIHDLHFCMRLPAPVKGCLIQTLVSMFSLVAYTQTFVNYTIDLKSRSLTYNNTRITYQSQFGESHVPPATTVHSSSSGAFLHDLLFASRQTKNLLHSTGCILRADFDLTVSNCRIVDGDVLSYGNEDCDNYLPQLEITRNIDIANSYFEKEAGISNLTNRTFSSQLRMINDTFGYLDLRNSEVRLLTILANQIDHSIHVQGLRSNLSIFGSNKFKNSSATFTSSYSSYQTGVQLIENATPYNTFQNDTINGFLNIQFTAPNDENAADQYREIYFSNCQINARCMVKVIDTAFRSKLVFENCSFGSTATLLNLQVDTLVFINCTNLPYPLFVTADPAKSKSTFLQLINSSVGNIRFDYTEKFRLYFDPAVSEETKNNTYQSLLAKYKAEGKPENLEKIDIEYKRYQYQQNIAMYPIWFLDYIWWRYGYSKWLVVFWCFLFIGIFFLYNYMNWEGMRQSYSVFDKNDLSVPRKGRNNSFVRKKVVYVLLFTSFIFFSLRIDFDKLKYSNHKYLMAFFIQYVIGLICLFFLANAIFKIG